MADHLSKARQSNAAAREHLAKVREREALPSAPDSDDWNEDTVRTLVAEEFAKRPPMESSGELVIDAAKRTAILRAPPWVLALVVVGLVVVAWLVWG